MDKGNPIDIACHKLRVHEGAEQCFSVCYRIDYSALHTVLNDHI